ncbi:jg24226, partial [Pararge aegeria aegeria]
MKGKSQAPGAADEAAAGHRNLITTIGRATLSGWRSYICLCVRPKRTR